jgi:hypothetical protein
MNTDTNPSANLNANMIILPRWRWSTDTTASLKMSRQLELKTPRLRLPNSRTCKNIKCTRFADGRWEGLGFKYASDASIIHVAVIERAHSSSRDFENACTFNPLIASSHPPRPCVFIFLQGVASPLMFIIHNTYSHFCFLGHYALTYILDSAKNE